MAPPVTEFALIPLKAGADMAEGSDDHKILMEGLSTILSQPGCQRCHYSVQHENPTILDMIIDWDSHDAHINFTKDSAYGPFLQKLGPIVGGSPALHHIEFNPHPPRRPLTDVPATEVLMMYFPTDIAAAQKEKIAADVKKAFQAVSEGAPELRHFSAGWLVEDDIPFEKAADGKAIALCALLGWDSVQAHTDCREKQVFKDNISAIRQAPGLLGVGVHHVNTTEITA